MGIIKVTKEWSKGHGCTMLASDCEFANRESRAFHNKIGFAEASINVHFTM